MNPDKKPKPNEVTFAKPKDGESREEFTKRVIQQLRERGLITEDKKAEQSEEETENT